MEVYKGKSVVRLFQCAGWSSAFGNPKFLDLLNASFVFSFGLAVNRISLPPILVKVSIVWFNLDDADGVSFLSSLISSP